MPRIEKKPPWLKVKLLSGEEVLPVRKILKELKLNTVCNEASCPNIGHCFASGTAAFMILGSACTRNCKFCNVENTAPSPPDPDEPARLAEAVSRLKLNYVVVTSVTRDDLEDGGAGRFAEVIEELRTIENPPKAEVLIPDFRGRRNDLETVVYARPDVLNHNLEAVRRLTPVVRSHADYDRSLRVLGNARRLDPEMITKSGLMLGLGETVDEIIEAMEDLRSADCCVLTLGQYLRPSREHLPVARYVRPAEFEEFKKVGENMGFLHVSSGPLVRSSFHSAEVFEMIEKGSSG